MTEIPYCPRCGLNMANPVRFNLEACEIRRRVVFRRLDKFRELLKDTSLENPKRAHYEGILKYMSERISEDPAAESICSQIIEIYCARCGAILGCNYMNYTKEACDLRRKDLLLKRAKEPDADLTHSEWLKILPDCSADPDTPSACEGCCAKK